MFKINIRPFILYVHNFIYGLLSKDSVNFEFGNFRACADYLTCNNKGLLVLFSSTITVVILFVSKQSDKFIINNIIIHLYLIIILNNK